LSEAGGRWVRIVVAAGDRLAVVERATGEPVQFLAEGSSPERLIERWDEYYQQAASRAARR
jgi:hypothetical protein